MNQTKPLTDCQTSDCKGKTTGKFCKNCNQAFKITKILKSLGLGEKDASVIATGSSTKCAFCKINTGISITISGIPTSGCIACLSGKTYTMPEAKVQTPVAAVVSADRDCKTCKNVFTPCFDKQGYCQTCMDKYKATTTSVSTVVVEQRTCKISTCTTEFTPVFTKQIFCKPCMDAYNAKK